MSTGIPLQEQGSLVLLHLESKSLQSLAYKALDEQDGFLAHPQYKGELASRTNASIGCSDGQGCQVEPFVEEGHLEGQFEVEWVHLLRQLVVQSHYS